MKNRGLVVRRAVFAACIMVGVSLLWGQTGTLNTAPKTPGKTNIAVINIKNSSGVTAGDAELISDRLRGELFNTGKVNVMEREQMQEILKEQGFQQSGACTNEACMVEIGQLLGVEQLVTGSLGKVGSMFLVNMRIIDVKTAKIMKVVSEDIKGDIEEVVGRLPGIASQLVGPGSGAPKEKPVTLEKKEEPKKQEERPAETVKEEKPEVAEPKEETKAEVTDERKEKNRNRGGIHLGFNIFGTRLSETIVSKYYDMSGNFLGQKTYKTNNADFSTTSHTPFFNPQLLFTIKAGPFLTVDVGPCWAWAEEVYTNDYLDSTEKWTDDINVLSLALGINFVKRWYPFKINAGVTFDFNYLNYAETYSISYLYGYFPTSNLTFHNAFNVAFGARVGAEIMAGKHVGFSVDFVYQYSYYETISESIDIYNSPSFPNASKKDVAYNLTLPPIAVGLGVNFYY